MLNRWLLEKKGSRYHQYFMMQAPQFVFMNGLSITNHNWEKCTHLCYSWDINYVSHQGPVQDYILSTARDLKFTSGSQGILSINPDQVFEFHKAAPSHLLLITLLLLCLLFCNMFHNSCPQVSLHPHPAHMDGLLS